MKVIEVHINEEVIEMDIPFENQYSSSEFEKHLSENLRP